MQIFANGKRRSYSFIEFYVIHLKNQGGQIWSQYHFKKSKKNDPTPFTWTGLVKSNWTIQVK